MVGAGRARRTGTGLHLLIASLIVGLVLVPPSASAAAIDWDVAVGDQAARTTGEEPVLSLNASPGAREPVAIAVINRSDSPLTLGLARRTITTPNGELSAVDPAPLDPVGWISLPTESVVAAPGRTNVPFDIAIPTNAAPGEYLLGLQVTLSTTGERRRVLVLVRVDGDIAPQLSLESSRLSYEPSTLPWRPGLARWSYTVRNDGDTVLVGRLQARLGTVFDRRLVIDERPRVVLLPGTTVSGAFAVTAWPTGLLRPEVAVISATANPQEGAAPVVFETLASGDPLEVLPWGALGVVGGLVVLATLVVAELRRRARSTSCSTVES